MLNFRSLFTIDSLDGHMSQQRAPFRIALAIFLVIAVGFLHCPAQADSPTDTQNLDDLTKKIEQGKAEKAKRDASAQKKAAEQKAREAHLATVVIRSDAPCALYANGEKQSIIQAGTGSVKVPGGQNLVDCISTEEADAKYSATITTRAGENSVLVIELAAKVLEIQRAKQQAQNDRLQAERDRLACEQNSHEMSNLGGGVLRQCKVGIEWTQSDNAYDINWKAALNYCQNLAGGGWRLPSTDELNGLYDASLGTQCGASATCWVSSKFRLTNTIVWSNEYYDKQLTEETTWRKAWILFMSTKPFQSMAVHWPEAQNTRALCVRP
jgi:hypothetical protein